eukprot:TRINITY_DN1176_c0_g1_i4.p1 TRINITY_DN1176_c0_g1~~TRINITY_DN1176_c0_g1_i4.p1  ORF type:complete len:777 (+),score=233.84 TRINITY_DN1176_c0_g1_i4:83-2332(+)
MLRAAAATAALAWSASANMYDTFSPELLPPAECKSGCAPWSAQDPKIWRGGKTPHGAGSTCAQVGSLVNSRTLGPWCYCNTPAPPKPNASHPLDGQVLALRVAGGEYVSFAYTAAPAGLKGSTEWMRAQYATNAEAMPLLFKAVAGKPNVYTMQNMWPDYVKWVSFTWTDNYLRAWYTEAEAMPVQVVPRGGNGGFVLLNLYPDPRANGTYLSMDKDTWLQSKATSADTATVWTVEAATGPGSGGWGYCTHGNAVPEQINVQIAAPDTVVISWVTFEKVAPTAPPELLIKKSTAGQWNTLRGVTHVHTTSAGDRTYYMHFVRATKLEARAAYSYQVRSGAQGAATSAVFSFRAPYASGETRIAIYGDMGVYEWNNMQQLYDDCVAGQNADLIVHMGDHAYNEGDSDERRADGYFNAFQKVIASCPWMPVVGNHEYRAGTKLGRYLDSTWDKWGPIAGGDLPGNEFAAGPAEGTADTALGAFLTTGLHHGPGTLGSNPSGTSRYFSADVGLIHLIALDLNLYFGCDPCGDSCRKAQLAWLEKDLIAANANRKKVPWVAAFSHYPLYCTGCHAAELEPRYYASDDAEIWGNANATAAAAYDAKHGKNQKGLGKSADPVIADLQPLFDKYSVDLYLAGHWHYYESLWPLTKGNDTCISCAVPIQKDFIRPNVTVHVTTGNGGPPAINSFCKGGPSTPDCGRIPATRKQSTEFGYGRLTVHNATHVTFQQFLNSDGSLFDEWTVVQPHHPFNH